MSETTEKNEITLPFMSETDIAKLSVSALSNRPNERSGQYGRKGLTPEQVKEAFSALPVAIAERMNELLPEMLGKIDGEEQARKDADKEIKASAVGVPEYDTATGVLTFKTLDGQTVKRHDIPIEKIIDTVKLSDDGTKLVFSFHNSEDIEVDVSRLTNPAWKTVVDDSDIPPTAKAVKEYAVKKRKYTDSTSNAVDGDKLYCVGSNGDKLIPLKSDALSHTVVVRDMSGRTKTSSPREGKDAANKEYVDGCIKTTEKRIVELERMASGYIYNDVIDNGRASCVQLPKVCNYGILSEVSGSLELVDFFLPYSFEKAVNVESHTENSFVGLAGKSTYIPCKIPAGAEVTVKCEGDGGTVATHFGLFAAATSPSVVVNKTALGVRVTPSSDVNYIYIYCTKLNDTDKVTVKNLEVIFTNPEIVHDDISTPADQLTITTLRNILIPQNLISFLSAYDYGARVDDDCYNYIDFTNKQYYHLCTFTDGTNAAPSDTPTAIDISSYLGDISDVVKLKPGCIMSFWDTSFNRLDANYQLSYKQMLL